ncbi:hypothetical protein L2719_17470 [Shewanella schlegeliana]|uniref:Uncharacterized protein n=1 Tax=Shewanella schlegeliana TaxID=190308 RepID=A0ABS1SVZ0_9GAMM|nr:hypothetical protein [Shewanella schlegeliana]MBL4912079.1 hypothetical protein [Shewanella schlegeliana]MCL1111323.1 hypothetical protein [Shewanella schlegeliana]GIU33017.1 hypothetical protein TUM4433_26770 [Shewanella schlegeliana]
MKVLLIFIGVAIVLLTIALSSKLNVVKMNKRKRGLYTGLAVAFIGMLIIIFQK